MLPLLPNDAVSVQRERSETVADASRAPQPEEGRAPEAPHDGAPPAMFLDRDHSILAFNERVFDWAVRTDVPLLERLTGERVIYVCNFVIGDADDMLADLRDLIGGDQPAEDMRR